MNYCYTHYSTDSDKKPDKKCYALCDFIYMKFVLKNADIFIATKNRSVVVCWHGGRLEGMR